MSNRVTKALHDLYLKQAEESTDAAIKAMKYECAALISKDRSEWESAAEWYWKAGKTKEAVFCSQQASRVNGG